MRKGSRQRTPVDGWCCSFAQIWEGLSVNLIGGSGIMSLRSSRFRKLGGWSTYLSVNLPICVVLDREIGSRELFVLVSSTRRMMYPHVGQMCRDSVVNVRRAGTFRFLAGIHWCKALCANSRLFLLPAVRSITMNFFRQPYLDTNS